MRICLNDEWKYYSSYKDDNYLTVSLPHTVLLNSFSIAQSKVNRCLYRKEFSYQDSFRNSRIFLCGRFLKNTAVYLNGKELSEYENNRYELSSLLKKDSNILEILTDDFLNDSIYLEVLDKTFISDISYLQSYENGNYILKCCLKYAGKINGYESVVVRLIDGDNNEIFDTSFSALLKEYSFNVGRVNEWSKTNPYLYTIEFDLGGAKYTDKIGFRHLSMKDGKLYFNDKLFKGQMFGYENIHPYINKLVNINILKDDIKKLKELNTDIIKTDYADETLLNLCDENGIMLACKDSFKDHSCIIFKLKDKNLISKDSGNSYLYENFNSADVYHSLIKVSSSDNGIVDFGLFCDNNYKGSKGYYDFFRNRKQNIYNSDDNVHLFFNGSNYLFVGDFSFIKLYYKNVYLDTYKANKTNAVLIDNIEQIIIRNKYQLDEKEFGLLMTIINDINYYGTTKLPFIARLHKFLYRLKYGKNEELIKKISDEYKPLNVLDDVSFEIFKDNNLIKTIKKKIMSDYHFQIDVSQSDEYQMAVVRLICLNKNDEVLPYFNEIVKAGTKGRISIMGPSVSGFLNGVSTFYVKSIGLRGKGILMLDVLDQHFELEFNVKSKK